MHIDTLKDITSHCDSDDDWNDIFLTIVNEKETEQSFIYTAKGLYKNQIVGFKCEINKNIKAGISTTRDGQIADTVNGFIFNGIQLYSIGEESDRLIQALAELYGFPTMMPFTKSIINNTIFSLNQSNVALDSKEYYHFKLFFEEDSEDLYAEIFLNINLKERIIELHEKAEEYRENIIKVFTKQH